MFKNLFLNLSGHGKLVKDIRNDNYKNWETHFNNYNNAGNRKADPLKLQALGLEIYESHLKKVIKDYAITDGEKTGLTKIKAYFQLPDAAINTIKSKYAKSALTGLSKQKLADNQLTSEEIQEMSLFAKELNISEEEVNRINLQNATELYENAVRNIISDKIVSADEQESLKLLAQQLGLNMRNTTLSKQLQDDYYYLVLLNALDKGYLPECKSPTVTIQKDEVAYWEISSNLVYTRANTVLNLNEDSQVRIKVAKGVSYKLGTSRSASIREHITSNHPGVFAVTNKGVLFAASQQSFAIPFTQLNSFDTYTDGIGLQRNNTELLLQFYDKQMSEVVFKVLTNAINAHA